MRLKHCCKVRNTAASPKEFPCKKPHQKETVSEWEGGFDSDHFLLITLIYFVEFDQVMLDILQEVPLDPAVPADAAATKPVEVASDSQEQPEALAANFVWG